MTSRMSAASSVVESAREPTRSQNMIVSWRRVTVSIWADALAATATAGMPLSMAWRLEIARNSLRRWPSRTPNFSRSCSVRSGRTLTSIPFSRKICPYCSRPIVRSQPSISNFSPLTHWRQQRFQRDYWISPCGHQPTRAQRSRLVKRHQTYLNEAVTVKTVIFDKGIACEIDVHWIFAVDIEDTACRGAIERPAGRVPDDNPTQADRNTTQ